MNIIKMSSYLKNFRRSKYKLDLRKIPYLLGLMLYSKKAFCLCYTENYLVFNSQFLRLQKYGADNFQLFILGDTRVFPAVLGENITINDDTIPFENFNVRLLMDYILEKK